jgi:hypothetical protein
VAAVFRCDQREVLPGVFRLAALADHRRPRDQPVTDERPGVIADPAASGTG